MRFQKYESTRAFGGDALEILLEHEVQNNLPIGSIRNQRGLDTSDWLMATIQDDAGSVLLTAACTPPHNIILYETRNQRDDAAVKLLSDELKAMGFQPPGVLAEQGLAKRFAESFAGESGYHRHESLNIMRLDQVRDIPRASGRCRPLREEDLFYAPYWAHAFAEDCYLVAYDIPSHVEGLKSRIGKDVHYIWEDGFPVSQAVNGRSTENGAVVSAVYTPPHFRGKGYATSVVAELSRMLLDRGNQFCCLFANAENPISCGVYRKIGYYDQCVFDELRFERGV